MLEELIVRYEEGMKLVKVCQERLASAEQRIEIITRNHAGKPVVKEFEPKAESPRAASPQEKGEIENDEVRLFGGPRQHIFAKNGSLACRHQDAQGAGPSAARAGSARRIGQRSL